jgi:nitrate reductase NapAB chaperone NapD
LYSVHAIDYLNYFRNIDHEIKLIVELHEQSKGKQIVAAKRNEETLLNEYRRIENLFRRLQVSLYHARLECIFEVYRLKSA